MSKCIEDEKMLAKLKALVLRSPKQVANILNSASRMCKCGQHEKAKQENRALCHWLYAATSHLDSKYSTQQRIHWVLNQLRDFPKCIVCGKLIDDPKKFKGIKQGYSPFCSNTCAKKCSCAEGKKTRLKKNNGKYFSNESLQKAKSSFMEDYGVDNNMKSDKGKKEYRDAVEMKYGKGITNVWQTDIAKKQIKKTKLNKHGDENWNNPLKSAQTFKSKPKQFKDDVALRRKKTCIKHFGVEFPSQSPMIMRKILSNRRNRCYTIDGHSFDSFPEFCFYVCCRDFGIEVQCHPLDKAIEYFDAKGKKHIYYPDFYLPKANQVVEVKGDHFFESKDPSKSMVDLFNEDDGSRKAESKQKAMADNNVLVITSRRYMLYQRRVKRKYGTKWIKSHKVCNKKISL